MRQSYATVSPHLLCLRGGTQIQISQCVIQRDQEDQQQYQSNKAEESLTPCRILHGLERHDPLVGITEVGFVQSFADALKAGLVDVEAACHGCCYDNDKNPVRSM